MANVSWTLASGFENLVLAETGDLDGTGNGSGNVITGNSGWNTLIGNGGNDTIDGRGDGDNIQGGSGNDLLIGGDEPFAEPWLDPGGAAFDMINGGPGNDTMRGGTGNDGFILSGDYGTDVIDGGTDPNGVDHDLLFAGGSTAFVVDLAAGTVTGGGFSGGASVTNVEGAAGGRFADRLLGNGADNLFMGRAGNDVISGASGNDQLLGEGGNDTVTGGAGADEFFFSADADLVTDFTSGTDKFVYSGDLGGPSGDFAPRDERFYAAANASAAHDDTDRIIYDTSSGRLYYDADGVGGTPALLLATLQGAPTLAATDITVW
jgi:Ca2+-binding RTX toxin-like protein